MFECWTGLTANGAISLFSIVVSDHLVQSPARCPTDERINLSRDVTSTYNTDCVTKSLLTANWQVCISVPNREFLLPAFGKKAIYLSLYCIIFHRNEKQLSSSLQSAEFTRLTSAMIIIFYLPGYGNVIVGFKGFGYTLVKNLNFEMQKFPKKRDKGALKFCQQTHPVEWIHNTTHS